MVKKLDNQGKRDSRSLWEEIFTEDTKEFLDYYYQEKTKENEILGIYDNCRLVSMLHLNHYKMFFQEKMIDSDYIVAVATKKEYRHQGKMAELIVEAMRRAKERKKPFVFLMPVKEAIYTPFGFETVYWRKDYSLPSKEQWKKETGNPIIIEEINGTCPEKIEKTIKELSEYSSSLLKEKYHIYTVRDQAYYELLLKEQESQKGSIVIGRKREGKELCGYCFLTKEEGTELREVVCSKGMENQWLQALIKQYGSDSKVKIAGAELNPKEWKEERRIPCIMARITDVESFLALLSPNRKEKEWIFQNKKIRILDEILPENMGVYQLSVVETPQGDYLKVKKVEEVETEEIFAISIQEILKKSLANLKIFLNEVV